MKCGIKLVVDYAFKRTFGTEENKNVLKHLLNAVLAKVLPQPIVEITILNPFSRKDRTDSKLTIVDIKARDDAGRDYIIEVQIYKQTHFPERLFFYGAIRFSIGARDSTGFGNIDYGRSFSNRT